MTLHLQIPFSFSYQLGRASNHQWTCSVLMSPRVTDKKGISLFSHFGPTLWNKVPLAIWTSPPLVLCSKRNSKPTCSSFCTMWLCFLLVFLVCIFALHFIFCHLVKRFNVERCYSKRCLCIYVWAVKLAQLIRLLLSVREVGSSSLIRSNALVKIECTWNSLGTHC